EVVERARVGDRTDGRAGRLEASDVALRCIAVAVIVLHAGVGGVPAHLARSLDATARRAAIAAHRVAVVALLAVLDDAVAAGGGSPRHAGTGRVAGAARARGRRRLELATCGAARRKRAVVGGRVALLAVLDDAVAAGRNAGRHAAAAGVAAASRARGRGWLELAARGAARRRRAVGSGLIALLAGVHRAVPAPRRHTDAGIIAPTP